MIKDLEYIKNSQNLIRELTTQLRNWQKIKRPFTKEYIWMANKPHEKMFNTICLEQNPN